MDDVSEGLPDPDAGSIDGSFERDASGETARDAADDPDGGPPIADGGDLPEFPPDDDAGEDGGLPDAGTGCTTLTTGDFIDTACLSTEPTLSGGALSSGTYQLYRIDVLGSAAFCRGTFSVYQHRATLEVKASSETAATFAFIDQYRPKNEIIIRRPLTSRYDVEVASVRGRLTYNASETCAGNVRPPTTVPYATGDIRGRKTIAIVLPYGEKGSALYSFSVVP